MTLKALRQSQCSAVAEPFMRIFGDGQLGIRVESPAEMMVEEHTTNRSSSTPEAIQGKCAAVKQQGNDLDNKKHYNAASGIRCSELVPAYCRTDARL